MSINKGKIFEQQFKSSVPDYCLLIRLNDPPQSFQKTARFSIQNPCDYLMFDTKHKLYLPIELKSTKSKSMPYSMVRQNQIESLTKFAGYDNVIPGFLLNYRDDDSYIERCYFMHINNFDKMMNNTTKKSFNEVDILLNGAIKICGIKSRTRWTWNVDGFLIEISERYNKSL